jgi:hypothetical protein
VFSNQKRHHHIIANRGSVWRVCLGGGNLLCFKFFLQSPLLRLSPMHSYGKRRARERSGRFRMVQDEALSFFWAKLFYPSALVGGFYNGFKVSFFTIMGYQYVRMGVLCFLVFYCRVCVSVFVNISRNSSVFGHSLHLERFFSYRFLHILFVLFLTFFIYH